MKITCTWLFVVALFVSLKYWQQPEPLDTRGWSAMVCWYSGVFCTCEKVSLHTDMEWFLLNRKQSVQTSYLLYVTFCVTKKSGRSKKIYIHLLIFAKGILERETRNHWAWKPSGQVDGNKAEWMRKWCSWVTFLYNFDFLEPCLFHILKYTNALINNQNLGGCGIKTANRMSAETTLIISKITTI